MLKEKVKLSTYFQSNEQELLAIDGEFRHLENSDTVFEESLIYCDSLIHAKRGIENPNVACLILTKELAEQLNVKKAHVISDNPRNSFYILFAKLGGEGLFVERNECGIGENTSIHKTAIVSEKAQIGNNCDIQAGAIIGDNVTIGNNVIIGAGAVVGTHGILYYSENGVRKLLPHFGGVEIAENTSVLANATIVYGMNPNYPTKIARECIIGIGSIIGHEANIGASSVISGNCIVARRAKVEESVFVGTNSMIREYVTVNSGAQVKAGSVVIKDVATNEEVSGNFAYSHKKRLKEFLINQKKN